MTRDDMIRMAREAGWSGLYTTYNEPTGKADWKMVKESLTVPVTMEQIERFATLVAAAEREACAELVWPTQQIKVWSDEELAAMTGAFNRAQEKHGWYETIMAVGATALKGRAAAIRSRT